MRYIIIIVVSFLASVSGAICGIGGGVIIKPMLDAFGIMPVASASFLSGCTVLSMSAVSFYKQQIRKPKVQFDSRFATVLALGSVAGGIGGKQLFQYLTGRMENVERIGMVQAVVLVIITFGTLIYTLCKRNIHTIQLSSKVSVLLAGMVLGILSSFLGIGGGPINLVILFYLFSMETKQAAGYSIYVIIFSQISSLASTWITGNIPIFEPAVLISKQ